MSWALARRFWWAVPIAGLLMALHLTRETLADRTATLAAERTAWTSTLDRMDRDKAERERGWATQQASALTTYADRLAGREPIILRSTDTVRTYAQTDAGRAGCLGADRVRGIDALDADLFSAPSGGAGSGDAAVPADASAPAG